MRVWISIRTLRKIPIEGSDDGVTLLLFSTMSCPLSDTWTASIGKYYPAHLVESVQKSISSDRKANLLRARCDGVLGLCYQLLIYSLLCQGSGSRNIFVRGVGARTNQSYIQFCWPSIFSNRCSELRNRPSQIWCKWTIYMRLQLRKVDFNHLIEV